MTGMVELDRYGIIISLPSDESVEVGIICFRQLHFGRSTFDDSRIAQPTQDKATPDDDVQVKGRSVDPDLCTNQPVEKAP